MTQNQNEADPKAGSIQIKKGLISSVSVYEITDYELGVFEQGGSSSVALNFCIFLYSIAISSITILTTFDFSGKDRLYASYFIISAVGVILGTYMLISWWRAHKPIGELCKKIRGRIVSE